MTLLAQLLALALSVAAIVAVLIDNEHGIVPPPQMPGPNDPPLIGPDAPEVEAEEPREELKIRHWKS